MHIRPTSQPKPHRHPRTRAAFFLPLGLAALLTTVATASASDKATETEATEGSAFEDIALEVGLDFVHWNGMSGELYFPEMTGQGGALFDYDSDGDLDIYLVQGNILGPGKTWKDAVFPPPAGAYVGDRLYRNDLDGGKLRFTEVTQASGIRAQGYGMGVIAGDYDGDGHVDLYVSNYGPNELWRNRGDGTFENVTAKAGVGDPRWSVSASFFDLERDGDLDLYVTNYVDFRLEKNIECFANSSRRDYCGPTAFEGLPDSLYRNRGDGTFEDISTSSRIAATAGAGLGVISADFDDDGWLDLFVANDGEANHLWLNGKDGTFLDEGLLAGVAVNREGSPEASMGVAAGDVDNDGDPDLFMTHLMGESNTLYVNQGLATFEDRSIESGLAAGSLAFTSFGTLFLDIDNDGWLDLFAASGAVRLLESLAEAGDPYPLGQSNQLFRSLGGGRFEDISGRAGPSFALTEVSRGAAAGDIDNDGDTDLLLTNNSGPARLLRNRAADGKPWVGLRLVSATGRDLLGTRVELRREGATSLWRQAATDGSYCSASDPRVLFGLGEGEKLLGLTVHWPDGQKETWPSPPLRRYTTLSQGKGAPQTKAGSAPDADNKPIAAQAGGSP